MNKTKKHSKTKLIKKEKEEGETTNMNKVYQRINWENYPNDATPLSAQNLNRLDVAADELDNRLIAMDTVKMDKITAATMVKDIAYNE